ncbi:MAG: chromosomal replication initiator protein DnaA [Candidatus Rokuibacteriota bacterium]|nr:MAG: chromosomal replication initiator protein DnaA [Candidatus Rokubacteria bacterium]PYN65680.1 MAG: chromosomal replication initiator protein DnaA [Candidatus Rokubacteria bacterium]
MLDSLWAQLLESLSRKLAPTVFDSWIRPCRLLAVEGDHLRIGAPNPFSRDWLTQHHLDALQHAAQEVVGGHPRVTIVVDEAAATEAAPVVTPPRGGGAGTAEGLNPRYTFDAFVVGSSNQFAQAACQAVAELPSRAYNPLFIYGGVGLGKTHLLHAVGHQSVRLFPGMAVVYISSERFTNELINAIRYDRTAEFRARYRTIDLLLIDDIQFISGKERTQEEFFHTFNDLYESRKQIIVSSDCSPKEIPEIEERLRSRFEWGLIADIQPPDFETRVAILKKKAALERVRLTDDVAYLIASRIKSNIRELEGSLTRMIAFCALTGREMTVDLAQEVLGELWGEEEKLITIDQIQRKVCDFFGIRLSDLKAKNRTKAIAFPRQIAMYLARQLTHASLSEVGRAFGGKDHTTVLHAVDKVQVLLQEDPKLRKTIDGLIQSVTL